MDLPTLLTERVTCHPRIDPKHGLSQLTAHVNSDLSSIFYSISITMPQIFQQLLVT